MKFDNRLYNLRYNLTRTVAIVLIVFQSNIYCNWIVDLAPYITLIGRESMLPCNTSSEDKDDNVVLILWYKNDNVTPIYTIDARSIGLNKAYHSVDDGLQSRAYFQISNPISFLRINPVQENDQGEYRCRVDFKRGRTINRIVQLSIIVPVTRLLITDSEGNQIDQIGGPFNEDSLTNLSCKAESGNPAPIVTWWKNDRLLDYSYFVNTDGLIQNNLSILFSRKDLMSSLTCQASNNNQTKPISKKILIDLNLKPGEVKIIKTSKKLYLKSQIEFVCQSSGSKPAASIIWKKSNNIIAASSEKVSEDGSVTTSFVSLFLKQEDHLSILSCLSSNPKISNYTLIDSIKLNLIFTPLVSLVLGANAHHEGILEGSDVYFDCNIQANPEVEEIGWLINGQPFQEVNTFGMVIVNKTILIENVQRSHANDYQCWAKNEEGRGESEIISLKIQYLPKCKSDQDVHYGLEENEFILINCQVDAYPPPFLFHWSFNDSSNSTSLSFTNKLKNVAEYELKAQNYGILACQAENSVGVQTQPCYFHIIPPKVPDQVKNCTITNATSDALTVKCLPGFNGGLKQYFHLEVYNELDSRQKLLFNLSSEDYPYFVITSLPTGVTLLLKLYTSNRKGISQFLTLNGQTLLASKLKNEQNEELTVKEILIISIILIVSFVTVSLIISYLIKSKSNSLNKDKDSLTNPTNCTSSSMANHTDSLALNSINSKYISSNNHHDSISVSEQSVAYLSELINKSGVTFIETKPETLFTSPKSLTELARFSFDDATQDEHIFKSFDFNSINRKLFSPF